MMAVSTRSEFIDFIVPLRERMKLYDKSRSPSDQPKNDAVDPVRAIPQGFIDAMTVREAVFVKEQGVPLEHEFDDDDQRSYHWTAYASVPMKAHPHTGSPDIKPQDGNNDQARHASTSTKIPIGTIRLVPEPHSDPHPNGKFETTVHQNNEKYVKFSRLAVVKEFRKAGIANLLIDTALMFIRDHPYEMLPQYDASVMEQMNTQGVGLDFHGLVLVHSPAGAQKVWRKYGFEADESMGKWDEKGIEHVGMWKRVDVSAARRKSKVLSQDGKTRLSN